MNDECKLCGISVNVDRHETCEVSMMADESGGTWELLLNLVHVDCVRAMIAAAVTPKPEFPMVDERNQDWS